jgi:MFS family permease
MSPPARNGVRFALLLTQVAFVGLLVGMERTVLPIVGREHFGLPSATAVLAFIVAFGLAKAPANLLAGWLADRAGRRRVLLLGWALGLPVPALVAFAPTWDVVVAANLLLGAQQGLCWSATLIMKVDIDGGRRRGLVIGVNELAGYAAIAVAAYATGAMAATFGARLVPFVLGQAVALAGLVTAFAVVGDTRHDERPEAGRVALLPSRRVVVGLCQAGLAVKLADVAAWGLLPLHLSERGVPIAHVALLAASYPAVWGLLQPLTGRASDKYGRRTFVVAGLVAQGLGLVAVAASDAPAGWLAGIVLAAVGTALAYPALLAAAADAAPAALRASAIGRFRFWRDLGFVAGGLAAGRLADTVGFVGALQALGLVAIVSAALVWIALSRARDVAAAPASV